MRSMPSRTSIDSGSDDTGSVGIGTSASAKSRVRMSIARMKSLRSLVLIILYCNSILSLRLRPPSPTAVYDSRKVSKGHLNPINPVRVEVFALQSQDTNDQNSAAITGSDADLMAKITASAEDNVFMRCLVLPSRLQSSINFYWTALDLLL